MKTFKDIFLADPEEHDFPAAVDYLELIYPRKAAEEKVALLMKAPTIIKKAKDLFRASGLPLLPKDNLHVQKNLDKFEKKKKLSPILLVRGNEKLIIADGYHRMCASYYLTEDLEVACRLV
jgi:hypothetical protein